jgi:hypothetical protein
VVRTPPTFAGTLPTFWTTFSWGVQSWWGPPLREIALRCDALRCSYGYGLHYVTLLRNYDNLDYLLILNNYNYVMTSYVYFVIRDLLHDLLI